LFQLQKQGNAIFVYPFRTLFEHYCINLILETNIVSAPKSQFQHEGTKT